MTLSLPQAAAETQIWSDIKSSLGDMGDAAGEVCFTRGHDIMVARIDNAGRENDIRTYICCSIGFVGSGLGSRISPWHLIIVRKYSD